LKFTSLFVVLSILVLGTIASPAWADAVPVQNASFEITNPLGGSCACGAFNLGPIPDWTITGGVAGSWQPSSVSFNMPLPNGNIVAYSDGATISQTLTSSLVPDTTYTLSVDVGHRLDVSTSPTGNGYVTDYTIALYVGSTLLKSFGGSTGGIAPGTFADETVTLTSGATVLPGDLSIVLTSDGQQADFDNVKLTASTVPEPSSLSLLAGALGVMFLALRRR
jgi:PEP-CTERM motif